MSPVSYLVGTFRRGVTWFHAFLRKLYVNPLQTVLRAIIALVVLSSVYYVGCFIHEETYVWQVTTMANMFWSVGRTSCPLTMHTAAAHIPLTTESHDATINNTNGVKAKKAPTTKPRIALLMIYGNSDGSWGESLMSRVIANRQQYADRHGYTILNGNKLLDRTRPAAWSKLKAMLYYINRAPPVYDYILYIDMDVVIMNPAIKLEDFISDAERSAKKHLTTSEASSPHDFIMSQDWNGVNTGIFLVRNSDFSRWFLSQAWNQTQVGIF